MLGIKLLIDEGVGLTADEVRPTNALLEES